MKLLLDTHIFLWYITGSDRLPVNILAQIRDSANEVHLSPVSIWEAVVKHQLGRLVFPTERNPAEYLIEQRKSHHISALPLDENSISRLHRLPPVHRDPFDRMLACQALENNLTLVTVDPVFVDYPVDRL